MDTTVTKTVTAKMTKYTTCILTYKVRETDTQVTITFTEVAWTCSRSGGLSYPVVWNINRTDATTNAFPALNLSGTASASRKIWGRSLSVSDTYPKTHSAFTHTAVLNFELNQPDSGGYWTKNITISYASKAKTSYKITLNANGGTGGTTQLTKWHNEALSLTSGVTPPARTDYVFYGWSTSKANADAGTVVTSIAASSNAAATIYASWKPGINGITLSEMKVVRTTTVTDVTEDEEGQCCYGTVKFKVTGKAAARLTLNVVASPGVTMSAGDATQVFQKQEDEVLAGTMSFHASNCLDTTQYVFTVNASAVNTSYTSQAAKTATIGDLLTIAYFPIDFLADDYYGTTGQRPGHGVTFGGACKEEGFHVFMEPVQFSTVEEHDTDYSTSVVGDFFTAANGVTVVNGQYTQWGKVAQFYLNLQYSSNIGEGNIQNINLGTIAAGKRPAIKTACGTGEAGPIVGVHVFQGGGVTMGATAHAINAGVTFSFGATYILA